MYKTLRISDDGYNAIEKISEALGCSIITAIEALATADEEALIKIAKNNLSETIARRDRVKVEQAVKRANERMEKLNNG